MNLSRGGDTLPRAIASLDFSSGSAHRAELRQRLQAVFREKNIDVSQADQPQGMSFHELMAEDRQSNPGAHENGFTERITKPIHENESSKQEKGITR